MDPNQSRQQLLALLRRAPDIDRQAILRLSGGRTHLVSRDDLIPELHTGVSKLSRIENGRAIGRRKRLGRFEPQIPHRRFRIWDTQECSYGLVWIKSFHGSGGCFDLQREAIVRQDSGDQELREKGKGPEKLHLRGQDRGFWISITIRIRIRIRTGNEFASPKASW